MRKIGHFMKSFFLFLPYKNIKITKLMYKNSNPWSILVKIKVSLIVKYFQDEIYLIFINFIPLKVPMYAWCLGWYSVTYSLSSTNKKEDYYPLKRSSITSPMNFTILLTKILTVLFLSSVKYSSSILVKSASWNIQSWKLYDINVLIHSVNNLIRKNNVFCKQRKKEYCCFCCGYFWCI